MPCPICKVSFFFKVETKPLIVPSLFCIASRFYFTVHNITCLLQFHDAIVVFPFQVESDSDFALIELDAPMPITDCIGPACLPSAHDHTDRVGSECIITGWGTTASSGPLPDSLQEASVTVLNYTDCVNAYAKQNDTATWMVLDVLHFF